MDTDFEFEMKGLGFQTKGYPGAFTPTVEKDIKLMLQAIRAKKRKRIDVLHLFSGVSLLGEVRVDLARPEATNRQDVLQFVKQDKNTWDAVILDPPYDIKRKRKLMSGEYVSRDIGGYSKVTSAAADVVLRNAMIGYFCKHVKNVIWLDMCAPYPTAMKRVGFRRRRLIFYFPGGFHTLRVLTWLERT